MSSASGLSLLAAAAEAPDRPAVIGAGACVTFGELARRARGVIAQLRAAGLAPPKRSDPAALLRHRVAVLGSSRLETLIMTYALIELGVPIVMIHPRLSPAERQDLLRQSEPRHVFDQATIDAWVRRADGVGSVGGPAAIDPESCLAVVRTSGSSGRAKGVLLSRRAFHASAKASAERLGWRDDDRWLLSLPLAHVGGLSILTRCLIARRPVVIPPWTRFRADPVYRTLIQDRVTLLSLVPTMLRRLLDVGAPPPGLRAVLLGGAAASPALLDEAAATGWPVLTTYGMTESCAQVTLQHPPSGGSRRLRAGCGPPLEGTEIRIVDGVVEIRGPTLMSGYFPARDESPLTADGWLRTADLGRLDAAGHLHLGGRQDEVIISGGENVSPLEVERVLTTEPAVCDAVVWGVDDEEWGQVVAAAVVWRPGERANFPALEARLERTLAPYARPRLVAELGALPCNSSGKVDRRRAAEEAGPLLRPWRSGPERPVR